MINVIPFPNTVHDKGGVCLLPDRIGYSIRGFQPNILNFLKNKVPNTFEEGRFLNIKLNNYYGREAYNLSIHPKAIDIVAGGYAGALYALITLYQLMDRNYLPCCVIDDEPLYAHRGLSLDCARHFFKVQEIKKIIDEMLLVKLNVLHWHLSDDQGWRIESKRFPLLQEANNQYYTQSQIEEIVQYAMDRGIEVIPEIDLPGHVSAILAAYPEYSCFAKPVKVKRFGGIYTTIFCPGKKETIQFIYDLLDEIIPLFPSERFHIGGDEAPKKEWSECADCKAKMEEMHLTSLDELQGAFEKDIIDFLASRGKKAICWSEVLSGDDNPNAQIQYWHVNHTEATKKFIQYGGEVIYSDMFDYYLDYPQSMTNIKRLYKAKPHFDLGSANGLYGMEACMWTEHVDNNETLEQRLFPRLQAFAERAWGCKRSYKDFESRLQFFVRQHHEVSFLEEDHWNPSGKERQVETLNYFKLMMDIYQDDSGTTEKTPLSFRFGYNFLTKFIRLSDIPSLMELYNPQNED